MELQPGDVLWAWQSEDQPGRWSLIDITFQTPTDPPLLADRFILIHRKREVVENWREWAEVHQSRFHQRIRMVYFRLGEVAEVIEPR